MFFWVKIFNWAQTETSNSSSTVSVIQQDFENRNIFVGLTTLSTVYSGKSVFHLNQFYFCNWTQLWQQKSQIGHKQKHLIFATCYNYSIIIGKCKCVDGHFIYSGILKGWNIVFNKKLLFFSLIRQSSRIEISELAERALSYSG